jgi:hypothetical protein
LVGGVYLQLVVVYHGWFVMSDLLVNYKEILPCEFQFKRGKHRSPRLVVYWDYKISPTLSQERLNYIVKKLKTEKRISIQNNPDRFLYWQYLGKPKPQIIIDRLTGKLYVSEGTLKKFGKKRCMQQASLLLRILRTYKLANFVRRSVTFNPIRVGRTKEQRQQCFEAAHLLFGDIEDK